MSHKLSDAWLANEAAHGEDAQQRATAAELIRARLAIELLESERDALKTANLIWEQTDPPSRIAQLEDFLRVWADGARLQSFEDRQRFRAQAAELVTGICTCHALRMPHEPDCPILRTDRSRDPPPPPPAMPPDVPFKRF